MKRRPRVVPVHLSDWEVGCCVPPFRVGDQVSWSLAFYESTGERLEPDSTTRRWRVERNGNLMLLVDGWLAASWSSVAGPPQPGEAELTGWLCATFHDGHPLSVWGRVRRIRVTTALLGPPPAGPPGTLCWVPGSTWSYDVEQCPSWFGHHRRDDGETHRQQDGYLVDLEIARRARH